jgi:hypothetical protein
MDLRYHAPSTYFLHIPKTAGMAFGRLLMSAYQKQEMIQLEPVTLALWRVDEVQHYFFQKMSHSGGDA